MSSALLFSEQWFEWTWKTSVCAALLMALVWLARKVLGPWLTPRWHYALSLLVLLRLLTPMILPSAFSVQNVLPSWARFGARPVTHRIVPVVRDDGLETGVARANRWPNFSFTEALSLAWAFGCLGLTGLAIWRYSAWHKRIHRGRVISDSRLNEVLDEARRTMGVRQSVTLVALDDLPSPAVFGVWRPRLLVPETVLARLNAEELRLIFLHEMAHVRRWDALMNLVLIGAQFLHWFNPLVWLAQHRLRIDRELVCDAMVMSRLSAQDRPFYGQVLLKLMDGFSAGGPAFAGAIPVVSNKHEMKRRIVMIKHHGKGSVWGGVATGLLVAALACATFTRAEELKPQKTAAPAVTGPQLEFDASSFDFGKVTTGEIVKHTYKISNPGTSVLEITNVVPGCGCTKAGAYTRRIEPGGTGAIPIQFDSAKKSGPVSKTVTIYSNAKNQPKAIVSFKGVVTQPAAVVVSSVSSALK